MSINLNDIITYGNAQFKVVKTATSEDINNLQNEVNTLQSTKANTSLLNLTSAGENHFLDNEFAILYPAGGTASNPNTIAKNTKYALNNPFPGYLIDCKLQFLYNNKWCDITVQTISSSSTWTVRGAYVVSNETNIYVYTSSYIAINTTDYQFNFPSGTDNILYSYIYTAPMRVLVWKIGKI